MSIVKQCLGYVYAAAIEVEICCSSYIFFN